MEKYWILLMFGGPLVGLLMLATIFKYIEVWRAKSWLAVSGRINKNAHLLMHGFLADIIFKIRRTNGAIDGIFVFAALLSGA